MDHTESGPPGQGQPEEWPPKKCRRPPRYKEIEGGELVPVKCRRPRCSLECFGNWAMYMVSCLDLSFRERPPDRAARVSACGLGNRALSAAHARLRQRLHRRGVEDVAVNEWQLRRHLHLGLFGAADLRGEVFEQLWHDSLPRGTKGSAYCEPLWSTPFAYACYLFNHNPHASHPPRLLGKDHWQLPPAGFQGRIFLASAGALVAPLPVLWQRWRQQHFGLEPPPFREKPASNSAPAENARLQGQRRRRERRARQRALQQAAWERNQREVGAEVAAAAAAFRAHLPATVSLPAG